MYWPQGSRKWLEGKIFNALDTFGRSEIQPFRVFIEHSTLSLPQESCISYNSGVPAEMEMRFTRFDIRTYIQLQFELTLNQLMCTCRSKSTLLTITCPNLKPQFVSTLKFHIYQQRSVIYTLIAIPTYWWSNTTTTRPGTRLFNNWRLIEYLKEATRSARLGTRSVLGAAGKVEIWITWHQME